MRWDVTGTTTRVAAATAMFAYLRSLCLFINASMTCTTDTENTFGYYNVVPCIIMIVNDHRNLTNHQVEF